MLDFLLVLFYVVSMLIIIPIMITIGFILGLYWIIMLIGWLISSIFKSIWKEQ